MATIKRIGLASQTTSISDVGVGLASAYAERMAERVERVELLSEGQKAVMKIEEKTDDPERQSHQPGL